jgi:uncharacterized membrane protein YqiK
MLAVSGNWLFVAWYWYVLVLAALVFLSSFVLIRERQEGIVVKRFAGKSLKPGRLIALGGEAGLQADTLAPGVHFGYWPWQYRVIKVPVTVVPQGEIALVLAADGGSIPSERILGRVVDCDNFQDARKFLINGGEKGRQIGILTAGTYRINTAQFTVMLVPLLYVTGLGLACLGFDALASLAGVSLAGASLGGPFNRDLLRRGGPLAKCPRSAGAGPRHFGPAW